MNKKEHHKEHHAHTAARDAAGVDSAEGGQIKSAVEIAMERAAAAGHPEEVAISSKDLEALRTEAAKAKENWDRFLRAQADLENYRKRAARERQELSQFANENLLRDLLTPLDHFEMGLKASAQTMPDDPMRQGMQMIFDQFQQFLKSHGVTEIEALGKPFDPAAHEAVSHLESDVPEGQVIEQTRRGYRLQGRVLRAAAVVVSKGSAVPAAPASSEVSSANEEPVATD
jgi:molecular chaperone GrpE